MRLTVDPDRFLEVIQRNAEQVKAISERGRARGAKRHMFLAGEGEVMIADEWDSEESFLTFFAETGAGIGGLIEEAGVSNSTPGPVLARPAL